MRACVAADPRPARGQWEGEQVRAPLAGWKRVGELPIPTASGALAQLNWGLFGPGRQDQETVESDPATDDASAPTDGAASEDRRPR
jgi:hypothetical protein